MSNNYQIALSFGPETTRHISRPYGHPLPRVGDLMRVPRSFYEPIAKVTNDTWNVESVTHHIGEHIAPYVTIQLSPLGFEEEGS